MRKQTKQAAPEWKPSDVAVRALVGAELHTHLGTDGVFWASRGGTTVRPGHDDDPEAWPWAGLATLCGIDAGVCVAWRARGVALTPPSEDATAQGLF